MDVVIVGAGIVGLAVGRELLRRWPRLALAIVDKEDRIAAHQSGHNSGVLHSGIYYAPGSLKARLCVAGKAALVRYCDEHGIPYDLSGKVIVATAESELPRLAELYRRGQANGVEGLEEIGPERLAEIEPNVVGIRALHSPRTGIVDYGAVARSYASDVIAAGGKILTGHEVRGIARSDERVVVELPNGNLSTRFLISCAGLQADRIAALTGAPAEPRIVPFRGDYYVLRPEKVGLVRSMIYPVPDPSFPFLGVHFTRRIEGGVWLGPNAVLAFAREGYGRYTFNGRDLAEALSYSGFQQLAVKFWRTGLDEMYRDYSKVGFLRALQRYMPSLQLEDLLPGPSGVRAQALSVDGKLVDDFVIHGSANVMHVRNAPSPAATSSLAIAGYIADQADATFGLSAAEPRVFTNGQATSEPAGPPSEAPDTAPTEPT
ncbi:MAG TPA: L-2-hydroxyglutarate oxidase [Chloroflexota bacterium]|nr:L-2-hydroxyglutarate oxidase [Chloroflexota bacterium]